MTGTDYSPCWSRTIGFTNRINSNVKKIRQAYDEQKGEQAIYLAYRVRVKRGGMNTPRPEAMRLLRDLAASRGS